MADIKNRIRKARAFLMTHYRFYGVLLTGLEDVIPAPAGVTTAATCGRKIYWCPEFVEKLTDAELLFTLAHEAAHCALLHHIRMTGRNPFLWNVAGDHVINNQLTEDKVGKMPEGGLCDPQYKGWSVERVYAALEQPQQPEDGDDQQDDGQEGQPGDQSQDDGDQGDSQDGSEDGQEGAGEPEGGIEAPDPGGCGGVIQGAYNEQEEAEQTEEWDRIVRVAASQQAKEAGGHCNSTSQMALGNLGEARIPWEDELADFVSETQVKIYDWSQADRRFTSGAFGMPGQISDAVAHGLMFVDTSGSMADEQLQRCFEEIQGILEAGIIEKMTIVEIDTRVRNVTEYEAGSDMTGHKVHGRGGTYFEPAWQWLEEADEQFDFVIYFTDLEPCDGFGDEPDLPVLWAASAHENFRDALHNKMEDVPFGRVIEVV
jgi:predicted metal-dependent peptidase